MESPFTRGIPLTATEHAEAVAEVARTQYELQAIAALAPYIQSEAHFQDLLAQIPGDVDRATVERLLRYFVTFPTDPDAESA